MPVDFDKKVLGPNFRVFGQAATYTPQGEAGVPVTVILDRPDQHVDFGLAGVQVATVHADVRRGELPEGASRGDRLEVDGETFIVRRIELDAERLVATLGLDPES